MADRKNETWADIAAEMRGMAADTMIRGTIVTWEQYSTVLIDLADRIEAAVKREIPQPDLDWKDICAKCMDGDIEPDCEYYGEPNGCNSPIYGENPKAKPAGNAAKLREAVAEIRNRLVYLYGRTDGTFDPPALQEVCEIAENTLAAPPRNCDVGTAEEQAARFNEYCRRTTICERCLDCMEEKHSIPFDRQCMMDWEQMPYVATQEGVSNGSRQ